MGFGKLFWTLTLAFCACNTAAANILNDTEITYLEITVNGKTILIPEYLQNKLEKEKEEWHWTPWQRTRLEYIDNVARELVLSESIDSFPTSIFTDEQLRRGGFLLYVVLAICSFTLLAIVCNDYFIPCVEMICEDLKIPQHIAAATFMSVATSSPEFFINVISTFLTQSDMGIGTIVGSAIFNALMVGAIGSLAAIQPIKIEMLPVTRDVIIYMVNVSVLVTIVWDGQIDWYESTILAVLYVLYFIVMFNSVRVFNVIDKLIASCRRGKSGTVIISNTNTPVEEGVDNPDFNANGLIVNGLGNQEKVKEVSEKEQIVEGNQSQLESLFRFPKGKSVLYTVSWLYLWPIKLALRCTIPSPVNCRQWYPFAFFMCILWIGGNSYLVAWSMTVIGYVFFIPESVMGMTFLALGGCLPEAFSIYIMSRRGEGGIGVSNALGANSLAILFALGMPWFIRSMVNLSQNLENTTILINSSGIDFVVGSLLITVSCLWLVLFAAKFTLRRSVGFVLLGLYIVSITFAILVGLEVIL